MNAFHDKLYSQIQSGAEVLWSPDPHTHRSQWLYGKVSQPKTKGCDLLIWMGDAWRPRHECMHVDDPMVEATRAWAEPGRGVFVISPRELWLQEMDRRMADLETKMLRLEASQEYAVLNWTAEPATTRKRGRPPKVE
jgi:hypothetical protein